MKKIIAPFVLISLMFVGNVSALNIGDAKDNFNKIKNEIHEAYSTKGDKLIDKIAKKYNKKEIEFLTGKIDKIVKKFEGKKLSDKRKNLVNLLKYVSAGLKVKAFEKKDSKVSIINKGTINRSENHVFKVKLYKEIDGLFKTVGHANAFLIEKNKLVTSSKVFDKNFDNISVCQSTSTYDLVKCSFVGSLIKKEGNVALIEIADKDIYKKEVSISPKFKENNDLDEENDLTIFHFSDSEIDNMDLEENITIKSNLASNTLGAAAFDTSWYIAGIVLEENNKNTLVSVTKVKEQIKNFINDKAEKINNFDKFSSQIKTENKIYLSETKDFEGKVLIRDLFKNFSRFDFAITSNDKRDYITYNNSAFETEIKIFDLKKEEIEKEITKIGESILTKEGFESEICKKTDSKITCEVEYETGKNIVLNFLKSDNKLVYIVTHTTNKDNFKKSKDFIEKISKNVVFK